MRFATGLLVLTAFQPLPATAGEYSALLDEAASALNNDYNKAWAFTETTIESEIKTVARYDPSRFGDDRWDLLTVDGRTPTDEEIVEFTEDKADETDDGDDGGYDGVHDMFQPESLSLIEEFDDHWLFSFIPSEDDFEDGFAAFVDGTLKVAKDGPYIESIILQSDKPFKPRFGVKISEFLTRLEFNRAAGTGPVVPVSMDVRVKVRAFLAISVNETISISYSDYEYVGD